MALLNKLAECASASGVVFKDGFVVNALRELSVGLCRRNCVLYKRSLYALARLSGTASVQVLTFRHPKLFKDVFFPFVLIVFQPLLGAVLLHSLCCNAHTDMLEKMKLTHPGARPLAYTDNTFWQDTSSAVTAAFPALCNLGLTIGLEVRLNKCGVYSIHIPICLTTAAHQNSAKHMLDNSELPLPLALPGSLAPFGKIETLST